MPRETEYPIRKTCEGCCFVHKAQHSQTLVCRSYHDSLIGYFKKVLDRYCMEFLKHPDWCPKNKRNTDKEKTHE